MLVQVVNATVYFDATWTPLLPDKTFYYGRILSVPALLKHALAIGLAIPDSEMLVCGSDGSAPGPASLKNVAILNGTHPPALSATTMPSRQFDAVPVPMVTRGGPDTEGYHLVGSARWNGTRLAAQSIGSHGNEHVPKVTPWPKKIAKALFRGSVWNPLPPKTCANAFSMPVRTFDNRSLVAPLCYRQAIVDRLQGMPQVDASYQRKDRLEERTWERYQLILVIGGNGGWSDRFKASLFHDSVSVLVDCGTHEWWYPLITEGVHYFRANTSVASIRATVRDALSSAPLSKIAADAAAYAAEIFELDNVAAYMAYVAMETASKLSYTPHVRPGFKRFTESPATMPGPSTSRVHPPLGFRPTDQLSTEQARARISKWLLLNDRVEALQALTHEGSDADARVLATQVANEIFPPIDSVAFDLPLPHGFSFG